MTSDSILNINQPDIFFHLKDFAGDHRIHLKLEGLNAAGSIKLKTAVSMIAGLEQRGRIQPGKHRIIESSSGNLGIALSIVCKVKGYVFTCIMDPNASPVSVKLIKLYGGHVIQITEKDEHGGYLNTRIRKIQELLDHDKDCVWTNQYANPDNPSAHERTTAPEIFKAFPKLNFLFIGTSTTGTLGGCARFLKEHSPETRLIAVEPEGSVTFGHAPGRRLIPGLGTSRRPEIASLDNVHEVLLVREEDTIAMCWHILERYGLFAGASTGTVLQAVRAYAHRLPPGSLVVAISPDFGDKYLDTVYNPEWVRKHYGDNVTPDDY